MNEYKRLTKAMFVKPLEPLGSTASYPAMKFVQNQHSIYLATIPVKDLFPFTFITRRVDDPILGFQRTLSEDRALSIARYLDDSYGSIPTNIILSAQKEAQFKYTHRNKLIQYKRSPKSFLVIDGQHRLFGYGLTKKDHRVPVAIYEGLSRKEEATLFIDINTNQRGVPAALLFDIKQVAEKETEHEINLRYFFDKLGTDSESPFCGFMSPSESRRGMISRVTFNRSVKTILDNVVMTKLSKDKQYELLKNYFKALEGSIEDSSLLFKSAYFEAYCSIFEDVLRLSYSKHRKYKFESLLDILAPLKNINVAGILTAGKTKITKAAIIPYLKAVLLSQIDVFEDMV